MKKNYEKPVIEVETIEIEDIMAESSLKIGGELAGDVEDVFFEV